MLLMLLLLMLPLSAQAVSHRDATADAGGSSKGLVAEVPPIPESCGVIKGCVYECMCIWLAMLVRLLA